MGAPRSTTRDLERYAGLFARRTQTMKSSAMRDLMAVTAQPEVISLAGGLPDTSTFPAEDFAALMARVAVDSSAAALQYGPTEGLDALKECIVKVMAAKVPQGTEIHFEAEGTDASAAVTALLGLVERDFDEAEADAASG